MLARMCNSVTLSGTCVHTVTLSGGTDNPDFRGFLIQGRVAADGSPTGQFSGQAGVSQPQCDGVSCT